MDNEKKSTPMKVLSFIIKLIQKTQRDNIATASNALTYKILLAIFPFLIFLMTLLGFFNIDGNLLLEQFGKGLPKDAIDIIKIFITEVIDTKSISLLSTSLIISIYSASSGFKAVMDALNNAYEYEESRGYIKTRIISFFMVLLFGTIILTSTLLLVFSDTIINIVLRFDIPVNLINMFFNFSTYIIAIVILVIITMILYVVASSEKISFVSVFPGAILTVTIWIIASKIFNIYINNFSKYSKVYGSIGGIFILMIWLNMISFALLLGGEVNAVISLKKDKQIK